MASSVGQLYKSVINDVINGVKEAFLDEGIELDTLQTLKQEWEAKVLASGCVDLDGTGKKPVTTNVPVKSSLAQVNRPQSSQSIDVANGASAQAQQVAGPSGSSVEMHQRQQLIQTVRPPQGIQLSESAQAANAALQQTQRGGAIMFAAGGGGANAVPMRQALIPQQPAMLSGRFASGGAPVQPQQQQYLITTASGQTLQVNQQQLFLLQQQAAIQQQQAQQQAIQFATAPLSHFGASLPLRGPAQPGASGGAAGGVKQQRPPQMDGLTDQDLDEYDDEQEATPIQRADREASSMASKGERAMVPSSKSQPVSEVAGTPGVSTKLTKKKKNGKAKAGKKKRPFTIVLQLDGVGHGGDGDSSDDGAVEQLSDDDDGEDPLQSVGTTTHSATPAGGKRAGAEDDDDEDDDDEDGASNAAADDDDPLNSGDDQTDEEDVDTLFDADNVVMCQFEKIHRTRNRWKFNFKDGIMHIDGKDHAFQRATGEAEW